MIAAFAVIVVALLSLVVPAAPEYDAWAYLTWGRELVHGELSTVDGPAFKPLPVAVCALLAPLGSAAPDAWLVVVRAGALAAVGMAAVLAAELVPHPRWRPVAAVGAGLGVVLTGGFLRHTAVGDAELLLLALALCAFQRHRAGRHAQALGLAAAAALVRVEVWPFLAICGLWLGLRHPRLRLAVGALAIAIPCAWLLPELAGSGELLRSGSRALVPNPGAPALADRPLLASLGDAAALLPLPLAALALVAPRGPARLPALTGGLWCVLVGVMAEAGFSGESRYALPGVALVAVSAGAGAAHLVEALARRGTPRAAVPALVGLLLAGTVAASVRDLRGLPTRLADHAELAEDLRTALGRAGGREAVLACGRPAVGRYRGTLLAYALDVPKRHVRADGLPDAVTFRSRLTPRAQVMPAAPPGGRVLAAAGRWRIEASCLSGPGGRSAARAR